MMRGVCGRFVASAPASELADLLDVDDVSYLGSDGSDSSEEDADPEPPPRWNVAPTDDVWAISSRRDDDGDLRRQLRRYRWGLVPSWAESPAGAAKSINARAETVMDKPMFRNALERRRCIVPADAFYEWKRNATVSPTTARSRRPAPLPYCFRPAQGGMFAFAGLWEFWREPGSGERSGRPFLVTCTIITTDANEVVAPVHDRMPVVLAPETWADWLSEGSLDESLLSELFQPAPDDSIVGYRVAQLVNDVRVDGPELIAPYSEVSETPDRADDVVRLFDPDALV